MRAVAAQSLELASIDRARRQFGYADFGIAAGRAEPAGNPLRLGRRRVEDRNGGDLPYAEFDKTLDGVEPVEREFLNRDRGTGNRGFLREPFGTGEVARRAGAVQALTIPSP